MHEILTAAQMKAADKRTSEVIGIPSIVLMERAALAVADAAAKAAGSEPPLPLIAVVAGRGNNGADGIAAGRLLLGSGYPVRVFLVGAAPAAGSLCQRQISILEQYGGKAEAFDSDALAAGHPAVVIDAITGIGQRGALHPESPAGKAVETINVLHRKEGTRVLAVDIPSGVLADTGEVGTCAVRADTTITFGYWKRGLVLYPGTTLCGKVQLADIGIRRKPTLSQEEAPSSPGVSAGDAGAAPQGDDGKILFAFDQESAADLLPDRLPSGNKGTFGKVLIAAGSRNMCGAAVLCARSAGRSGAGMVKVLTPECNREIVQTAVPEALLDTYDPEYLVQWAEENQTSPGAGKDAVAADLTWADTVVLGPGIGRDRAAHQLVRFVLHWLSAHPFRGLVIDADAVRILGEEEQLPALLDLAARRGEVVLTPHLAECAALLHLSVAELSAERFNRIQAFADAHHCTLLCKDARSAAAGWGQKRIYLNVSGNDALATAGSGDVLAGMTGAFLAQGMHGFDAACAAAWLHGKAAEELTGSGSHTRSVIAPDLPEALRGLL